MFLVPLFFLPMIALAPFGAVAFLYFIPSLLAFDRGHRQRKAILMLNLFLGWTFLGWVASVIWAMTYSPEPEVALLTT